MGQEAFGNAGPRTIFQPSRAAVPTPAYSPATYEDSSAAPGMDPNRDNESNDLFTAALVLLTSAIGLILNRWNFGLDP